MGAGAGGAVCNEGVGDWVGRRCDDGVLCWVRCRRLRWMNCVRRMRRVWLWQSGSLKWTTAAKRTATVVRWVVRVVAVATVATGVAVSTVAAGVAVAAAARVTRVLAKKVKKVAVAVMAKAWGAEGEATLAVVMVVRMAAQQLR